MNSQQLAVMETGRVPRGVGFQANGPGMQVGNIWRDSRVGAPMAAAEGLDKMALGLTANGRLAAAKALHPACDVGPQRWPDKAANETLVFQNTDVFTVTSAAVAADKTYNAQIYLTNLIDCCMVTAVEDGTKGFHDINANLNAESSGSQQKDTAKTYGFWYSTPWGGANDTDEHPSKNYQQVRITARSITIDLVSNATSNQGIVYATQFSPNMSLMPFSGAPSYVKGEEFQQMLVKLIRRTIKEETLGSEFSDVVSLSENDECDEHDELLTKFSKMSFGERAPVGDQSAQRMVFQEWPIDPQQAIQLSPGSYMAKADAGVYLPLKHASDTLNYVPTSNECYLSARVPHENDEQTSKFNVLLGHGWNMGAIFFAGLAHDAILSVKVITCLEATPRADSALAKFTEEAPPLDKIAQDHTRACMGKLPDAFPASDNVLGGIVKWIGEALAATGIPILSQGAALAGMVNRATGEVATNWLDANVF